MDPRLKQHSLGFYEIAEKPTPEELQKYYAEKYYQEAKGSYEHAYSYEELECFRAKLEQRYFALKKAQPNLKKGGRFLEVGCGEGFALAFFLKHGYTIKGIDFSSAGVESKNPKCKDFLVTGDIFNLLEKEIASGNVYEIVWLQNVLEHVLDPVALLQSLRNLVSPEGVAVVTVPNDYSAMQRKALEKKHIHQAFWVSPPDHLSYFDYTSLKNIASATGWHCADLLGDFPVDLYLFHPGSNYVQKNSLGKDAHKARVDIENLISEKPAEHVIGLWRSLAQVGLGRNLTGFLIPEV